MKYWYAKVNGRCYKFKNKQARDIGVTKFSYIALTAPEAMKQFGYTDSASRRVIRAEEVLPETEKAIIEEDIFSRADIKVFIRNSLAEWKEHKQRYSVIYEHSDTSKYIYLYHWNGNDIETYLPGNLNEAQQLIELYHFPKAVTRAYLRDSGENVTDKLTFN